MDKEDARYQTLEQLHERRKQVIRLHKRGIKVMELVQMSGLSYPAVRKVLDLFEQGGWPAIKTSRSWSHERRCPIAPRPSKKSTSKDHHRQTSRAIEMDFFLWSRAAVMQLIEQECGFEIGCAHRGQIPGTLGFHPTKPIKKAYEQRPEAVKAWLDEHYLAIEAKAKAEGGEIHWGDETALVNTDVRGRSYAPAGETPVAFTVGSTRQKLSMIATVTNRGKTRWMIIDEAFNSDKLIEFLEALIKDAGKRCS